MNRALLLTSAAALPMLADASLKSAALLLLAGVCVLFMRRASAAAWAGGRRDAVRAKREASGAPRSASRLARQAR